MTSQTATLYSVAERLDEFPVELLNGGANDALRALAAIAPEDVASQRGIDVSDVRALWDRADARLRERPEPDRLYSAAAEAANLLYAVAWISGSTTATAEDLRAFM